MINEINAILAGPQVVIAGRHRIKITPPNLAWWIRAAMLLKSIAVRATALAAGPITAQSFINALESPSLAMLDLLAETTDKWPSPSVRIVRADRFPRFRLQRVPRGTWLQVNMTPQEFGIFITEWMRVVDIKGIKDVFLKAGEAAGIKMPATAETSPAASRPSPTAPDGQ